MSSDVVDEFLEHYGAKGMKWGVRKQQKREHKDWLAKSKSPETANQVYQDAVKSFGPTLKKINKDPMFADISVNKASRDQYDAVLSTIFNQHLAQASANRTFNAATDRAVVFQLHGDLMRATEVKRVAEHAEGDVNVMEFPVFKLRRDEDGYVIEIVLLGPDEVRQSELSVSEFLEHHGVRGQKWGVRKPRGDRSSFRNAAEAKKVSELKRKPASSLTNKQLKTINERINLEQNYNRLNPSKMEKGKKATTDTLATIGIGVSVYSLVTSPAGKAAIKVAKKALSKG